MNEFFPPIFWKDWIFKERKVTNPPIFLLSSYFSSNRWRKWLKESSFSFHPLSFMLFLFVLVANVVLKLLSYLLDLVLHMRHGQVKKLLVAKMFFVSWLNISMWVFGLTSMFYFLTCSILFFSRYYMVCHWVLKILLNLLVVGVCYMWFFQVKKC